MTDYEQFLQESGTTPEDMELARKLFNYDKAEPLPLHLHRRESMIEGDGLFGLDPFGGPEELGAERLRLQHIGVAWRDRNWTQVGLLINHSPTPNAIAKAILDEVHIFAIAPISVGEEITINYRQIKKELNL